tara:strand:- start:3689 stop:4477 length:789 start_codon:yes stop_codon:yes gene_type:complete
MNLKLDTDLVLVKKNKNITEVTLNRPTVLNALSSGLREQLSQVFTELGKDEMTDVIILTGAGRAFTVGLDLKELGGERPADAVMTKDLYQAIADVPQPIIAAVNGYAITGGFEIALMCDFMIASETAQFADTHARVGVVPGWGLSQRLPRLIGINRAKQLSLTGNYLDAQTALAWGLVNKVVPNEELLSTCRAIAEDICSTEPITRNVIKDIMDKGWHTSLEKGLDIEAQANRLHARKEVRPQKVAQRRADIQQRGRNQAKH